LHTRLSGASGARHSLRPLNERAGHQEQTSRETRGEIAKLYVFEIRIRSVRPSSSAKADDFCVAASQFVMEFRKRMDHAGLKPRNEGETARLTSPKGREIHETS
jgi:hypothetical protein